jgi:hypothetical protein
MICCSEADGSEAQEDIRDGHYWTTRLPWRQLVSGADEVVIRINKVGRPVVLGLLRAWEVRSAATSPAERLTS